MKEEAEDLHMRGDDPCKEKDVPPEISTDPGDTERDVKADEEEEHLRIKQEEIPIMIGTDGSSNRNPPERCPRPLYSWDSTQEDQEIPQEDQVEDVIVKVEIKEEPEDPYMKDDDPCRGKEIPPEISTDPGDTRATQTEVKSEEEELQVLIKKDEEQEIPQYISIDGLNSNDKHSVIFPNVVMEDNDIRCYSMEEKHFQSNLHAELPCGRLLPDPSTYRGTFPDHQMFRCSECGNYFTDRTEFVSHQKSHMEKVFSCCECGKCFTRKSTLTKHKRVHTGEKPFSCSACGRCFSAKDKLVIHQRIHTGEKPFPCSECGKCFRQKSDLATHRRSHKAERPFSCSECGKCYAWKDLLIKHQKSHTGEKPYSCTVCGKCFTEKVLLSIHQRVHTGEKPYTCSECGKSFTWRASLVSHQRTHTGAKPFSCSECGKCFSNKGNLSAHQKTHINHRPYSCSECGKGFTHKSNLVRHERVHTGVQPYACSECGKRFTRKSTLISHLSSYVT